MNSNSLAPTVAEYHGLRTPEQAAHFLTVSIGTLARFRMGGTGPAYIQVSAQKIGYRQSDLDAFLASRVRTSTSQKAA